VLPRAAAPLASLFSVTVVLWNCPCCCGHARLPVTAEHKKLFRRRTEEQQPWLCRPSRHLAQLCVAQEPHWDLGCLIVEVASSHTHTHTYTLGTTPLNEWSARHWSRYLHYAQRTHTREEYTAISRVRTRNPNNLVAVDLRLSPWRIASYSLVYLFDEDMFEVSANSVARPVWVYHEGSAHNWTETVHAIVLTVVLHSHGWPSQSATGQPSVTGI
jgi:hypothetical protein